METGQFMILKAFLPVSLVSQETGNKTLKEEGHKAGILPLTASAGIKIQNQSLSLN